LLASRSAASLPTVTGEKRRDLPGSILRQGESSAATFDGELCRIRPDQCHRRHLEEPRTRIDHHETSRDAGQNDHRAEIECGGRRMEVWLERHQGFTRELHVEDGLVRIVAHQT
jgi:hypothetical protein